MDNKVIPLHGYGVYEYFWGTAVKEERTGKWTQAIIGETGQVIELGHKNVIIHENGIEFVR